MIATGGNDMGGSILLTIVFWIIGIFIFYAVVKAAINGSNLAHDANRIRILMEQHFGSSYQKDSEEKANVTDRIGTEKQESGEDDGFGKEESDENNVLRKEGSDADDEQEKE